MTISFRPAKLESTPLMIGLAGPSGSGKTYSSLRLAKGIAGDGKIVMIDTESGRGLHYANMFKFEYGELKAPFRPEAYLEAIMAAAKAGANVIIIDSMSHEHEGIGGILEWQLEEVNRMAGDDYKKREAVKFSAWIKPKASHNKLVNTVLQTPVHLIFNFRAKDKLELKKDDNGKIQPVAAGWQPICADRFEYEMTALLVLPPGAKGVPDLEAKATKLQEQHRHIIKPGVQIDEAMGAALASWANGDAGSNSGGAREDAPAHQGGLRGGSSGSDLTAKAPDPLFSWIGGDGKTRYLSSIEEWKAHVIKGIHASIDAALLDDAFERNASRTHALRLAGHSESVDKVQAELRDKLMTFNPLRGG
jgi:hypothetical protein